MAAEPRSRSGPRRRGRLGEAGADARRVARRGLSGAGASGPLAALQLLHPRGAAATGPTDVVLVAPSDAQLDGLEALVRDAAAALAPDGLAYVVVPGRQRRRACAAVEKAGLVVEACLLHVPHAVRPRLLVPLDDLAVRFALARLGQRTWPWRLARIATRFRLGPPLLAARLPVGVVGRAAGAAPLLRWLHRLTGDGGPAVLQIGARGDVVVYAIRRGQAAPAAVAKVAADPARLEREALALRHVGESARAAGADVPRLLGEHDLGGVGVLVETPVAGIPLARTLAGRPRRFERALDGLAEWLAAWHRLSATPAELTRARLEAELLGPAARVAEALAEPAEYLRPLEELCRRTEGTAMPLVGSHEDLTSINVLEGGDRLGIVDWEHARADGLPLTDFLYAAADIAAAVDRHRDRLGAFEDCFVPGRRWTGLVASLERRLRDAVGLPDGGADVCFHACWARHAANELRASGGRPGEFGAIAARAAALRR